MGVTAPTVARGAWIRWIVLRSGRLSRLVEAARGGRSAVLVVQGEGGVAKTRAARRNRYARTRAHDQLVTAADVEPHL
jgi:hypothetical protein